MSEGNQSSQEKSLDATPGKLERARKKGEMPRSQDSQTTAAYIGMALAFFFAGSWGAVWLGQTLMTFISRPQELALLFTTGAAPAVYAEVALRVIGAATPVLLLPPTLILILLISQRAIVMSPEKLLPKLSRISPIANAKQKYGPQGIFEFAKSAVKLCAVAIVLGFAIYAEIDRLPGYTKIDARHIGVLLDAQLWSILPGVVIVSFMIAALDFSWQRFSHLKRMRMTHQEMKDESRQSEGDPQMRASRRERAREIANNRMLNDVATSDVVIVNPTHYAVALKWSRAKQTVPICVAKGQDELARRIRMRAEQAGVPIHSDPPTARSIHALVDVGQQIMPDQYKAVAAAIVFADEMRQKERERNA